MAPCGLDRPGRYSGRWPRCPTMGCEGRQDGNRRNNSGRQIKMGLAALFAVKNMQIADNFAQGTFLW